MNKLILSWEDSSILKIQDDLILANLPISFPPLTNKPQIITIDFSATGKVDTAGANELLVALKEAGYPFSNVKITNATEDQANIFQLVSERSELDTNTDIPTINIFYQLIQHIGQASNSAFQIICAHFALLGQLVSTLCSYLAHPDKIRRREIFTQLQQTGINAIPVILLVNFLIGIVMAYLLSMQAEKFGASIFVVDGVALAMCREMSPILVAIILAGRSGSAFTAQLGAMKLTEEIDAIKSIGLNTFDVLIFPRILALIIAMPLLVFLGDIIGIYGGMLVTNNYLGLSSISFMERLEQVLTFQHVLVGLIKAPAFALVVGMIACRVGMEVKADARSVGLSTTTTVVRSIVMVILMNAAFSVTFANIGF